MVALAPVGLFLHAEASRQEHAPDDCRLRVVEPPEARDGDLVGHDLEVAGHPCGVTFLIPEALPIARDAAHLEPTACRSRDPDPSQIARQGLPYRFPPDRAGAECRHDGEDEDAEHHREGPPHAPRADLAFAPFLVGATAFLLGAPLALPARDALGDVLALAGGQLVSTLAEPALGFLEERRRKQRAGVLVAPVPLGEQRAETLPPEKELAIAVHPGLEPLPVTD
jgi:hypothetical protein